MGGRNRRRLSRKKYSHSLLPFSLRGEGTAVMEVGVGVGGGETAVSDGYTAKLVPALPHSLTTTPAICSSAHLQTARHRSTEDKVR